MTLPHLLFAVSEAIHGLKDYLRSSLFAVSARILRNMTGNPSFASFSKGVAVFERNGLANAFTTTEVSFGAR